MSRVQRKPAIQIEGASFDQWWARLRLLAARHEMLWLLSDKPEDHRASWRGGLSPAEELEDLVDDVRRSF